MHFNGNALYHQGTNTRSQGYRYARSEPHTEKLMWDE